MLDKCEAIAQMAARDNLKRVNNISKAVVPKKSIYVKYIKRVLDFVIVLPVFLVLLPVNMIIGIITFFDVGRPIFYKQLRTGKDGKPFYLIKFRNMTNAKDEHGNLLPPNERVTKFGKYVRKYSLDELLNFWCIIKGDMSLIGPRPLPVEFEIRYSERHKMRSAVRPGLECPCINADNHVRLYQEQFENDIWYAENVSFLIDVKMVLRLVIMVFNSKERGDHAAVSGGSFVGYNDQNEAFSMRRIPENYEREYEGLLVEYQHNDIASA
jgi:lipopolysaccharide/colanic/teichoic acid biosynthesis glycosyltransferase